MIFRSTSLVREDDSAPSVATTTSFVSDDLVSSTDRRASDALLVAALSCANSWVDRKSRDGVCVDKVIKEECVVGKGVAAVLVAKVAAARVVKACIREGEMLQMASRI